MTLLVRYPSKRALKSSFGSALIYRETSMHGPEYKADGRFAVAYRPSVWKDPEGGREFFATVTMQDGKIFKVE